jgi:hypothetical protein
MLKSEKSIKDRKEMLDKRKDDYSVNNIGTSYVEGDFVNQYLSNGGSKRYLYLGYKGINDPFLLQYGFSTPGYYYLKRSRALRWIESCLIKNRVEEAHSRFDDLLANQLSNVKVYKRKLKMYKKVGHIDLSKL